MSSTHDKVGYLPESKYVKITPDAAATGIQDAIRILEGRWKLLIIMNLFAYGTLRFSQLEKSIPDVTQKMLIQQLRALENDGIVSRIVYPQVPPKVEYSLTETGKELCPALDALLKWAAQRNPKSEYGHY
ncbi:winged helix-turn-helix transcriptional regulator [Seleniivibrio woodruffii]|uniref:HxlR family transcriptional regulator n=1 Tax=Seleniivibrio woodruffii TaxID=1078050 RepID=A0A4R1K940_9BACT|nr:helix-turn-helix domain-containing protein [Seleniivibrio woodruffii]TCK60896.1 HxlR family transcriptional regulator [Seleniivibrio woodruffii]TVZ36526.1 HxlR family transcriptional regulator [Seleniivibrio woodruffii]